VTDILTLDTIKQRVQLQPMTLPFMSITLS